MKNDGQLPQAINEDENENEHRDTSHARFCFLVRLYNKRGLTASPWMSRTHRQGSILPGAITVTRRKLLRQLLAIQ